MLSELTTGPDERKKQKLPKTSPFDPKTYDDFMRRSGPEAPARDRTPEPDVFTHTVKRAEAPAGEPEDFAPVADLSGEHLGQYALIHPIGRGGMATVYLAHQASMMRHVAVKVLPPYFAQDPTFAARFRREAELAARLEHQNILPIYEYGEDRGYTYIVMRYVPTGSLRTRMDSSALSPLSAYKVAVQVARALDYAHKQNVLHRDVKPSNVLIDADEQAYLTDFGIAKVMLEGDPSYRTASRIVGTPGYMAPEQVRGERLDQRSDVYALGGLVYEMLTGRVPYSAHTPIGTAIRHVVDPVPDPRMYRSDLPEPIAKVIRRAMAKAPDNRFDSAAGFSQALSEAFKFAPRVWLETGHEGRLPPDRLDAELLADEPTEFLEFDETVSFSVGSLSYLAEPPARLPDLPIIPHELRGPSHAGEERISTSDAARAEERRDGEVGAESPYSRMTDLLSSADEPADKRPALRQLVEQPGGVGVSVMVPRSTVWPNSPPTGPLEKTEPTQGDKQLVMSGASFAQRLREKYGHEMGYPVEARREQPVRKPIERIPFLETARRLFTTALVVAVVIAVAVILTTALRNRPGAAAPSPAPEAPATPAAVASPTPRPQPTPTRVPEVVLVEELPTLEIEPKNVHFGWQSVGDGDRIYDLALSQNYVWAATGSGLIRWDAEGQFTRFASENGLASNRARAVAIQPDGALWVGTLGSGLSEYDGSGWVTFTMEDGLPGNDIYVLAVDRSGEVWAGTDNGLAHYAGGSWESFSVSGGDGLQTVSDLAFDSEGALWAITASGVSRFDGQGLATVETLSTFGGANTSAIGFDNNGMLWIGTTGSGISNLDGSTWKRFVGVGLDQASIHAIATDPEGNLWLGTSDGLRVFDGEEWAIVGVDDGLPGPDVWAVAAHTDAGLWVGTQSGLAHERGRRWEAFTTDDGLGSSFVQALDFDSHGQVWIGTYGGGLATFDGNAWQTFTARDGLAGDDVWSLLVDKNDVVWAGTLGHGLSRYDGTTWQTYTVDSGLAGNDVWTLTEDQQGALWVTTSGRGVHILEGETFIPRPVTSAGEPWAMAFDRDQGQWLGTFDGVLVRAPDTGTVWSAVPNPNASPRDRVLVAYVDDVGRLWLGTAAGGVLMFNGASWTNFTIGEGLASNTVWAIAAGPGNSMWFGTSEGITLYNGTSWRSFGVADGLAGEEVRALRLAPDGRLWVGTSGGLSVVEPDSARLYR